MADIRVCKGCGESKFLHEFNPRKDGKDGIQARCKECLNKDRREYLKLNPEKKKTQSADYRRDWRYKHAYQLTLVEYNTMLIEQNHKCKICGIDELETPYKRLVVDHNHITGKVRALLCNQCNTALGMVQEDKNILLNMINYLGEYHS